MLLALVCAALPAAGLLWGNGGDGGSLVGAAPVGAQEAGTPASRATTTVLTPVVVTVVPQESIVTPQRGVAEATTEAAETLGGKKSSGNPFTGVRGGFIGAGIGLAIVLVATVVVRGARVLVKERRR